VRPRADTLFVWTGRTCVYGCGRCPIPPDTVPGISEAALVRTLSGIDDPAGRLAVLVGGEPLLRADASRLLALLGRTGLAPGVVTTGRSLQYPAVRERLRRLGLQYLRLQLFGTGAAHDAATGVPGSFAGAVAGVRDWIREDRGACDVDVALTIRGQAIDTAVSDVPLLAAELPFDTVQLILALDSGAGDGDALQRTISALATWNDHGGRPLLAWERVPTSAAPASILTARAVPGSWVSAPPDATCLGSVQAGDEITDRQQRTAPNSFNFVAVGHAVTRSDDAAGCTAHATTAGDPIRQLWLVDGDRLQLYASDTGDFSAAEIAHVKDDLSHLFVDRAPPGVLDDFVQGMRRVLPDPVCGDCRNRQRCGTRFVLREGPPFAAEEAWIEAYVAGLRGRVLDVGCGEQLYRATLAPLLRSGAVSYTGLDPDATSLAHARAALPQGRFLATGIEQFRGRPGAYDRVLCLRSLNHVTDLDDAVARMAQALAPGGELLIVETTPFAMLRRPEQVAAADRAPRAGHQHFRNVTSEDVLPLVRRHRLRVLHHHPISRAATNQWILLLARAAA
jgi:SAM-dependent methyltransferase